jgi:putative transcriptional regulator
MAVPLNVGTLLIASLALEDPNFHRSVVLIIQHAAADGTLGLILNRPLGDKVSLYSTEELQKLAGAEGMVSDARAELGGLFFQGGPVQPGYLFFLHRLQDVIQGGSPVCPGVYLGGDLEAIRTHATALATADPALRFYLGYSGWKEGQLEAEIGMGAWMLAEGRTDFIFDAEPEQLWQRAVYSLGGKYRALSFIPDDPKVN